MNLTELRNVLDSLNINTKIKIKKMQEFSKNIEVNEWVLTFSNSLTEIKIDADEMDKISEPYANYEVITYTVVEDIEVMESYFKKNETILRNVNCSIHVELKSE